VLLLSDGDGLYLVNRVIFGTATWWQTYDMSADTIEEEAMSLPPRERAKLAERLLESLDNLPERDVEVSVSVFDLYARPSVSRRTSHRCAPMR
jgi:hypothetical protein